MTDADAPKKRGRPKGSKNTKPAEAPPAQGDNFAPVVKKHIRAIRAQMAVIKDERNELKLIKDLAKADGLSMSEVAEAIRALDMEEDEREAREQRRRFYMQVLGLIPADDGEAPALPAGVESSRLFEQGKMAGLMGALRKAPAGTSGDQIQDWLRGYDAGQDELMAKSPLTSGGGFSRAPEPAPLKDGEALLVLGAEHFPSAPGIDMANLGTLIADRAIEDQFQAATRVVVIMDGKKRVLKEPDDTIAGGYYIDTGKDDAPVSPIEDVEEAET